MRIQTELAPNCLCAKSFSEQAEGGEKFKGEISIQSIVFFFCSHSYSLFFQRVCGVGGEIAPLATPLPPALWVFFRAISVNLAFSWGIHPSKIDAWLSKSNWIFHIGVKSCLRLIFEYFLFLQEWFSHVKFNIFLTECQ